MLLLDQVQKVFAQGWPVKDGVVVEIETLRRYVLEIGKQLEEVITRLTRRLRWALDQMERLDIVRSRKGTLDPDEDALRARCDRLIKKLKGLGYLE